MIKKNTFKRNEALTFCIIFFFFFLLSRINIPFITNYGFMPDYFLALFVSFVASRFMHMNIYILFLLGLLVDLLAGELIGQYGLIFISIYFTNFILNKYFIIKSILMRNSQYLILTTLGLIILLISSLSYELNININIFIIKWVLTYLVVLLYNQIIRNFSNET